MKCFLAARGGCDGRLDRAHWIPKRLIRQQFPYGAMIDGEGRIVPQARIEDFVMGGETWTDYPVFDVLWDPRCWTYCCRHHHSNWDQGVIRVRRGLVPVSLFSFAEEYGLLWFADRAYPYEEVAV